MYVVTLEILPFSGSNQWPIRFESFWLDHPNFLPSLTAWWHQFTPPLGIKMYQFQEKHKYIKQYIKVCNKEVFGDIFKA
jgi:hypothetical protein